MTLKVSEDQLSLARSLEIYWDLDNLLYNVSAGNGIYAELNTLLRNAFKAGQIKYLKYKLKLEENSMIYAAYILDPRYRINIINSINSDSFVASDVISSAKDYFIKE
jgi:hypothetical protein